MQIRQVNTAGERGEGAKKQKSKGEEKPKFLLRPKTKGFLAPFRCASPSNSDTRASADVALIDFFDNYEIIRFGGQCSRYENEKLQRESKVAKFGQSFASF